MRFRSAGLTGVDLEAFHALEEAAEFTSQFLFETEESYRQACAFRTKSERGVRLKPETIVKMEHGLGLKSLREDARHFLNQTLRLLQGLVATVTPERKPRKAEAGLRARKGLYRQPVDGESWWGRGANPIAYERGKPLFSGH